MTSLPYTVFVRFYEELNDFLPGKSQKKEFAVENRDRRSVKDLIESLGVPHTEVDLILVNGESVDFSYIVHDGDRISVYPEFEGLDVSGVTRLRPRVLRESRFVLDVHLGRLARLLRLLGFDTDYHETRDDRDLEEISAEEKRILLTRDRGLLKRKGVDRGFAVRSTDPEKQAVEVLDRLDLWSSIQPFSRCTECNGTIEELSGTDAGFEKERHRIPARVLKRFTEFHICGSCRRIYWKGSHYDKLIEKIERIVGTRGIR
jgi:uncharacterized protein with PIN domain/sulfur carrier protein ThiS